MSLDYYQKLQENSRAETQVLGVNLPTLKLGNLSIKRTILNPVEMLEAIEKLVPEAGWIMYRDSVEISAEVPKRQDIIEAEYCNNNTSLQIKLVGFNQYSVAGMTVNSELDSVMSYKTQQLYLREPFSANGCANYRIWYKQGIDGINKGRWSPYAQQFIGFTPVDNSTPELEIAND